MLNSVSRYGGFVIKVDDPASLPMSPDSIPAQPLVLGPRLAVTGRRGPKCRACRDFQIVVTRTLGTVECHCVASNEDAKPALPVRPQPHERDGRQPSSEPARPHPGRTALLVG